MITTLLFVLAFMSGLNKGQEIRNNNQNNRGQELTCYECASKNGNDTCNNTFRKTIKTVGFDKRCRIMEMNGKVVSQGVVPKAVCSQRALQNVSIFPCLQSIFSCHISACGSSRNCVLSPDCCCHKFSIQLYNRFSFLSINFS